VLRWNIERIAFALEELGIAYTFCLSRVKPLITQVLMLLDNYQIVINCTPIGTSPDIDSPATPYELFTDKHIAYDLIYNQKKQFFA
jgi:shikimate dehydrogenase